MRTLSYACLVLITLIATSTASFAWGEETISLANPSGRRIEGTARIEKTAAGWYCLRESDAEILVRRFKGKISARDAESAFGRCRPDVQAVMGVFPERGIEVIFVRLLPDLRPRYFVPGVLASPDQQEARAPPE